MSARPRHVVLSAVLLAMALSVGAAANFASTSENPQVLNADTDFRPPVVEASTIAKTTNSTPMGTPGFVRQDGTFRAYVRLSDQGTPAAGVGTTTANLTSLLGATATAVPVTDVADVTIRGTTYTHASTQQTVVNPTAAGTRTWSLAAADLDPTPNTTTATGTAVTVDNTAPTATGVQAVNGGTVRRIDAGDTVVLTFSEQPDPEGLAPGWDGTSARTVRVDLTNDDVAAADQDSLRVFDPASAAYANLGRVNLARNNFVTASTTIPATMTLAGSVVTVTLGTPGTVLTQVAAQNRTLVWSPALTAATAPTDRAGNAVPVGSTRNEGGTADPDF